MKLTDIGLIVLFFKVLEIGTKNLLNGCGFCDIGWIDAVSINFVAQI